MKLALLGQPGGESDVIIRTGSEFPPIHVTKWMPALGERIRVEYGRARLKSGFIYFYAAEDHDERKRFDDTVRLILGLPASAVLVPAGLEKTKTAALFDAARQANACIVELAHARIAKPNLAVSRRPSSGYRAVPQFEFSAAIQDRSQLSAALWELYQAVKAETNG